MTRLISKSSLALIFVSAFALSGCDGSSSKTGGDTGGGGGGGDGGDNGGGDMNTSYRQFVRDAYVQDASAMPLTVNDKEFTFDVMDTAEFDDLVQGGTIDGGA